MVKRVLLVLMMVMFIPLPVRAVEVTDGERDLLAALVFSEANTEDLDGKRYVVDTVLNRVEDDRFPDSISAVVFQPSQYYTKGFPKTFEQIPVECYEAVDLEMGYRANSEILYFRTGTYHSFGTPVFQYGAHYFSK